MATMTGTPESLTFDLHPWLHPSGRVATATVPTPSAVEDAPDRLRIHWKDACSRLEQLGASPELLEALTAEVEAPGRHAEGESALVLGQEGGPVATVPLADELGEVRTWYGPLPRLTDLLAARQASVPHVVVIADRAGADILVVGPGGEAETESVEGETLHLTRSAPGGWSQRRFQQRAENTWEQNAAGVAAEVDRLRGEVAARIVVAAGDERALQFLRDHAPATLTEVLVTVDGAGRNDPDRFEEVAGDVARHVADVVARDRVALLERYERNRRTDELAADGPDAVLEVLAQGRVEVLLVHDDPGDERTAYVDLASGQVAASASTLSDLGLEPAEARLVDAAVWAALRTGAQVQLVPAHGPAAPTGGLGALLRG